MTPFLFEKEVSFFVTTNALKGLFLLSSLGESVFTGNGAHYLRLATREYDFYRQNLNACDRKRFAEIDVSKNFDFRNPSLLETYIMEVVSASTNTTSKIWIRSLFGEHVRQLFKDEVVLTLHENPIFNQITSEKLACPRRPLYSLLDWLLAGPYDMIVDLTGEKYFCELERIAYEISPFRRKKRFKPHDVDFWKFKHWFALKGWRALGVDDYVFRKWKQNFWKQFKGSHRTLQANATGVLFGRREIKFRPSPEVSVIGWHNGIFGIGRSAALVFSSISYSGLQTYAVRLYGAELQHHEDVQRRISCLSRKVETDINVVVANPEHLPSFFNTYPRSAWASRYNIGVWAWEVSRFPAEKVRFQTYFDEIWVPSKFVRQSLTSAPNYDGTPVSVIPFAVSAAPQLEDRINFAINKASIHSDEFVFLVVFDFLSGMVRKNPQAVVRAFKRAFPSSAPTEHQIRLVIKTTNFAAKQSTYLDYKILVSHIGNDSRITVLTDELTDGEVGSLFDRVDCYVSLHRGEGFGLNILEAMMRGTPTIATDYGGNTDFFDVHPDIRETHYGISFNLVILDYSDSNYPPGCLWAEPSHDEAVRAMLSAVRRDRDAQGKERLRNELDRAASLLRTVYGPEAVARTIRKQIESKWIRKDFVDNEIFLKYGDVARFFASGL